MQKVILVDENDTQVGVQDKLEAHIKGQLHRAFSVFLVNKNKEILLQRRSAAKYHSQLLWSNSCCSHPRPNEELAESVNRRLVEELGVTCAVTKLMAVKYCLQLDCGLIEHEFDHVFVGKLEVEPKPNSKEVAECKWLQLSSLEKEIEMNPDLFTEWFKYLLCKTSIKLELLNFMNNVQID